MATVDFKLDFTYTVPQGFLPSYKKATSAYQQTLKNPPRKISFRTTEKRGVFIITVEAADAAKLDKQKLTYSYGPHDKFQVKIPLERKPAYVFRTNAKFVYIDWWQDSGLRYADNACFDKWLEDKVTIISNCADDEDRDTGFRNGRKKIQVDFNKGQEIERFPMIECGVTLPDGRTAMAKGKVKVTYRDQPVFCRLCNENHVDRCPVKKKQELETLAAEEARAPLIKTLMIGDSNLRHVDQIGTTAKVCASTGAKLGHTANAMKFEQMEKYESIVIHSGANNISMKPDIDISQWETQLRYEVQQLAAQIAPLDSKDVKTVLVSIPKSELSSASKQTEIMRNKINAELQSIADTHTNVTVVEMNDDLGGEIDAWSDYRHYSEMMCAKMLEAVNTALSNQLLRRGKPPTTSMKYGRVHTSYRLGCGACTRRQHSEENCPGSATGKRGPPSGSDLPLAKR